MAVERIELAPGTTISRLIRGGWQLAGGHGPVVAERAVEDLLAAFDAGITTFDCADIYTGVEELYGRFRARLLRERGAEAAAGLRIHTKLVPDLATLRDVSRGSVRAIVEESRRRLGLERLHLVQFHWWDYDVPGYLDAVGWLHELRREGLVEHVGGTNFDAPHTAEMIAAGLPPFSMQVQYSLLDARPETALVPLALRQGMPLFCYGTVAGGFLSDRWLGAPEPRAPLENRSLTKYKLIIDDFGGWVLFQELLAALRAVADRHGTDIASVASRAILDRPGVAAVIVGARSGAHVRSNATISDFALTDGDRAEIAAVTERRQGPEGDTFTLERDRGGRHGSIMKYDLNSMAS